MSHTIPYIRRSIIYILILILVFIYAGTRKLLKYNIKGQSAEDNVMTSALLTLVPMSVFPQLRPLIPYGMLLIAIDCINGLNDV